MKTCLTTVVLLLGITAILVSVPQVGIAAKLGLFQHHEDVGITPKRGKAKYESKKDQYLVTGGGANMWLKADAFQYLYKQISGDVAITADVRFLGKGVEAHRKAALLIRQSLDPDSAYADVALHGAGLTSLQYRAAASALTQEMQSDVKAPGRIQIQRHGNEFTIAVGNAGETLKATGPVTVILHDPVYIGLAVCSHNANVLETAVFSNVKLEQTPERAGNRLSLLPSHAPECELYGLLIPAVRFSYHR
jgi:TolB protein